MNIGAKDYTVLAVLGRYAKKYEGHIQTYLNIVMEAYNNSMPKIRNQKLNKEIE